MNLLWHASAVAVGGACGATLRFAANELFVRRGWWGLPLATFTVNVVGCFLAGLLLVWVDTRGASAPWWRNLLIVGVLGGLTTFSALGVELWQYLRAGRLDLALGMSLATLLLGVLAVALGFRLGKALFGGV
jgi:CrcB protein